MSPRMPKTIAIPTTDQMSRARLFVTGFPLASADRRAENVAVLPVVIPESELCNIGREKFGADRPPRFLL